MKSQLLALVVFGIAFAFVESAVVLYLQQLPSAVAASNVSYKILLNLGVIAFVLPDSAILGDARIGGVETTREFFTLVMLAAIAFLSGSTLKQRLGAFFVAFAVWDIMYYVFLRVLTGWPTGLLDVDVYFLIPVPWVGPVLTPLVISTTLLLGGAWLFLLPDASIRLIRPGRARVDLTMDQTADAP